MIQYILETTELNDILQSLNKLFCIRITFFDMNDMELNYFDIKPLSDYCGLMRKDSAFNRKCIDCDHQHLIDAKADRKTLIYKCHSNLYEGIIPLYEQGKYFGSLVFGPSPVSPLRETSLQKSLNYTGGYRVSAWSIWKILQTFWAD